MLNVRPEISPWTTSSGWRTHLALRPTSCSFRANVERLVRPSGNGRPSLRAARASAKCGVAPGNREAPNICFSLGWLKRYHCKRRYWRSASSRSAGCPSSAASRNAPKGANVTLQNRLLGVCVEAQSTVTEFNRSSQLASQRRNRGHQSRVRVRAVGLMALASGPGTVWPLNAACAVSGKCGSQLPPLGQELPMSVVNLP